MCLAVPGKIIEINGDMAIIDYDVEKRKADCSFVECQIGDYVIISNKIVIEVLNEEEALSALKLIKNGC